MLRQRRERTMQDAKERQMEKFNAQAALQARIRADKVTQPNQHIKCINDATESEDNSDEIDFPINPLNKPKLRVPAKTPLRYKSVHTEHLLGDPLPGISATNNVQGHKLHLCNIGLFEFLI